MIRCPPVSASWHMFTLSKLAYASKDRLISVPALWFVESRRFGDRHQLSSLAVRSTHQHHEHTYYPKDLGATEDLDAFGDEYSYSLGD